MVIGIDAREAAGQPAGKGRYVQELLRYLPHLAHQHELKCYTKTIPDTVDLPANAVWQTVDGGGLWWHRTVAKRAAKECDVYFSTTSYLTPQVLELPFVMTVYDLISFKKLAIPQRRAKLIERYTLARAVQRARAVLTISQATANDLSGVVPASSGKITVTPLAADARFKPASGYAAGELDAIRKKYDLPQLFLLCTGTIEPRKNLVRLINAFANLPEQLRRQSPLVLAGKRGWQDGGVFEAIKQLPDVNMIRHLDFPADDDLAKLYAATTIFCYPSLYEGFGLPVLEAMQAGAPVITSSISSLPEVGGEAVLYVDPRDTAAITEALTRLLEDDALRQRMAEAGLQRAKEFSWSKTAKATLEVLTAAR